MVTWPFGAWARTQRGKKEEHSSNAGRTKPASVRVTLGNVIPDKIEEAEVNQVVPIGKDCKRKHQS